MEKIPELKGILQLIGPLTYVGGKHDFERGVQRYGLFVIWVALRRLYRDMQDTDTPSEVVAMTYRAYRTTRAAWGKMQDG
jgi:hypothetical protein